AGTSSNAMWPDSAIRCTRASEYHPSCFAIATKSSFTSGMSTPAWFRMNATANSGSMPEEHPAMIEMVPVGATVVRLQLRSRRSGRMRSPRGPRAQLASGPQIDLAPPVLHEQPEIHGPEIADVVREQRLLAARVRGLVAAELWYRVVVVGPIDEIHPRLTGLPRAVDDFAEHLAGVELPDRLAAAGMDQIVGRPLLQGPHEGIGDRHGDVEVRDLGEIVLAGDELEDVRVVDAQDAHVGPATRAALLHHVGGRIVQLHERHGARRHPHGGA